MSTPHKEKVREEKAESDRKKAIARFYGRKFWTDGWKSRPKGARK